MIFFPVLWRMPAVCSVSDCVPRCNRQACKVLTLPCQSMLSWCAVTGNQPPPLLPPTSLFFSTVTFSGFMQPQFTAECVMLFERDLHWLFPSRIKKRPDQTVSIIRLDQIRLLDKDNFIDLILENDTVVALRNITKVNYIVYILVSLGLFCSCLQPRPQNP